MTPILEKKSIFNKRRNSINNSGDVSDSSMSTSRGFLSCVGDGGSVAKSTIVDLSGAFLGNMSIMRRMNA